MPAGWTQIGGHGVEIFFVLSGFLITGKLLEDGSLGKFYLKRVFRILPILFAYLATMAALGFGLHWIPLYSREITASLFFVRNYCLFPTMTINGAGWFTGHLWSLSIEEQFYLIWPLLLVKVGRGVRRRQLVAVLMLFGLGCGVLAVILTGRLLHLGGWHWLPNVKFGGLLVGCLLRIGFSDVEARKTITRFVSGRSLVLAAALLGYFVVFQSRVTVFDPVICGLAVCATLLQPNSRMGRFLELPALRWIGRLSYSLYIWQQMFLGFGVVYRPLGVFSVFPINLAATVLVACASYYLLEKPMMRVGQELAEGRRPVLKAMSATAAA